MPSTSAAYTTGDPDPDGASWDCATIRAEPKPNAHMPASLRARGAVMEGRATRTAGKMFMQTYYKPSDHGSDVAMWARTCFGMSSRHEISEPSHHASCSQWRPIAISWACATEDFVNLTMPFTLPDLAQLQQEWWTGANRNAPRSPHADLSIRPGTTATRNLLAQTVVFERTP